MGLATARTQAVQGLQAQSAALGDASKNIANSSTIGYKASRVNFSTLVTDSQGSTGGVNAQTQQLVDRQGLIENTGRATDLSISGNGFFAVQDPEGELKLTRAGAFDTNNQGILVNANGFELLGWPLDNDGRKPGEAGNANTTASESVESLEVVDTNAASGTASPTTSLSIGANLDASESIFQGATVTLQPFSAANSVLSSDQIIAPLGGISIGDELTLESASATTTFDYGGFARSSDLSTAPIFGASSAATVFATSITDPVLNEGDRFTITSANSGTVTFTFTQSSPDTNNGEFNSLLTLATAMNNASGLTARIQGTELLVSSTDANQSLTFNDIASSNLHSELGLSDVSASVSNLRWNTFTGLAELANSQPQLGATIINAAANATIDIYSADPLEVLNVTKTHSTVVVNPASDENGLNTEDDIIVPINGHTSMEPGTTTLTLTGTNTDTFTYGGFGESKAISATATIFGATTATEAFIDGTSGLDDNDEFIFGDGTNTVTVLYDATGANIAPNEFNSLTSLAAAINQDVNFSARVVNNRLYVASSALPNAQLVVNAGTDPGANLTDANIVTEFGGDFSISGADVEIVAVAGVGVERFFSLQTLDNLINGAPGITDMTATITTGANASMTLADTAVTPAQLTIGGSTNAELLRELGFASGDVGDQFFSEFGIDGVVDASATTGTVAVSYDPVDDTKNLAAGNINADFSRNVRLVDSLGTGHDFRMAFLKTGINRWAIELYSLTPSDITGRDDGQIVNGIVEFNGDGSLRSVSASLSSTITIPWTTGASANTLDLNFGTAGQQSGTQNASVIGLTDGLRQFDSAYNVEFVEQNGVASGLFTGIEVTDDGSVFARFSNGDSKAIYQLPVLTVASVNDLTAETGNVWSTTQDSGDVNIKESGLGGAGVFVSAALESSTSDIAEELTRTIGIQSAYNANTTLISTARDMEDELNRRL